jgi:hypothetical protein
MGRSPHSARVSRFPSNTRLEAEPSVFAKASSRSSVRRQAPRRGGMGPIQNLSSRLLISQRFLPRSVPNRHLQGALRTKCFFGTSVPKIALSHADARHAALRSGYRRTWGQTARESDAPALTDQGGAATQHFARLRWAQSSLPNVQQTHGFHRWSGRKR